MPYTNPIQDNLTFQEIAYDVKNATNLRAIDVLAEGTLFVEDVEGVIKSWVFDIATLNSTLPYRVYVHARRIIGDGAGSAGDGSTGTDIALDDLIGLH